MQCVLFKVGGAGTYVFVHCGMHLPKPPPSLLHLQWTNFKNAQQKVICLMCNI